MNIFAQVLVEILEKHDRDLGSLFGLRIPDARAGSLRPIPPSKVVRLRQSLDRDITATLNSEELEALQAWAPLDEEGKEMRRLRAALVAEGVRHLLAGRIQLDQAYRLGRLTFESLIDDETGSAELWREELLETARGFSADDFDVDALDGDRSDGQSHDALAFTLGVNTFSNSSVEDTPSARALEAVAEAYAQGALWLAIAEDTPDRLTRSGFSALANSLFERARDMALHASSDALDTREQTAWLETIEAALGECAILR